MRVSDATIGGAIMEVAIAFGCEPSEITASGRARARERHMVYWLASSASGASSTELGRIFDVDHSTIRHGKREAQKAMTAEPALKALGEAMKRNLQLRDQLARAGGIRVLDVARRIYVNPGKEAIAAHSSEILALAATVIDLWEVGLAAEALTAAVTQPLADDETTEDRDRYGAALVTAITDEMKALRGDDTKGQNDE